MLHESDAWSSTAFPEVVLIVKGKLPTLERERISGAVGRALGRLRIGGGARVRVTASNCAGGPLLIQVNLQLRGQPARVQTLTPGGGNILSAVIRLERQITSARALWHPRPWPDPTRPALDGPGQGVIARRKAISLITADPLTAAQFMDALDYDAHLFTDADTGEEAVIYRAAPLGIELAHQHKSRPTSNCERFPTNPHGSPTLTEAAATQQLCNHGSPFLFFTDRDTGRGYLLYRRYDADLTLLTPADAKTDGPTR